MSEIGLLGLVERLAFAALAVHEAGEGALEKCAQRIEDTAKSEFGSYQDATGPFPAWAELAESTKEQRVALGYSEDEPLLREGTLRDSIEHETHGAEAVIGSTSEIMPYHEFGTSRIPPRPVLGPALDRNEEFIKDTIGKAMAGAMLGDGTAVHRSLGYDRDIG